MYKKLLLISILLLMIGTVFAGSTPPVTTFSSYQVTGTTDTNITLACTDDNSGCKAINYNVNNEGWNYLRWHSSESIEYDSDNLVGKAGTSYSLFKSFDLNNISQSNFLNSFTFRHGWTLYNDTVSSFGRIIYTDGTDYNSAIYTSNTQYYPNHGNYGELETVTGYNGNKDIDRIEIYSKIAGGGNAIVGETNIDYDRNYWVDAFPNYITYSGAGDHNIQYFSTDNADNNESIKTSYFPHFTYTTDQANSRIRLLSIPIYNNENITSWAWTVNGTLLSGTSDQNRYYSTQANLDLNVCVNLNSTYSYCQSVETWDTITPTMDLAIDTDDFGFVTDFGIDYNFTCYDNFSLINYLITWNNNGTTTTLYDSNDTNSTLVSDTFDINSGQQATLTFTCTDSYGNFVTQDSNTIYAIQFNLIDEDTADTFDLNNVVTARAFTYGGLHVYDFKDTDDTTKYFFSDSTVVQFEFTYDDLSATRIHRDFDFQYAPDENIAVCVAQPQAFYEQRFLSKSSEIVLLKNTFANCYNMIATTKDLYGTKLMARAFTINKPYTYANSASNTVAFIDGSKESEIDLDVLRYNTTTYELDILGTSITFAPIFNSSTGTYTSDTVRWYYENLSGVSTKTVLELYKDNVLLWSYTELDDPNDFEATMYYGDLDINITDLLVIKITKTTSDGETTLERTFSLNGTQYTGLINEVVAVIIAMILLIFGLTITSYKNTFGWFGILIEAIALIVLALAPWYWYIIFLQGIVLIMIIFTAVVARQETGGII